MSKPCCPECGLETTWCCCNQITPHRCGVSIVLLLNENEPARPTTTSRIIQKALPETQTFIWQRTSQPDALLKQIETPNTDAWLLFPADRPEMKKRVREFSRTDRKNTLIIVPDGTWKEVRKIVRKSPWLEQLPILALAPQKPTQYTLRRNAHPGQLCSAEALSEALIQIGEAKAGQTLHNAFDLFMGAFNQQQKRITP